MTSNEGIAKSFADTQNVTKNHISMTNDRNNNKNGHKEKNEAVAQYKDLEASTEKSNQSIHTNSKSGVSLKCAYCEAREDFKSR